MNHYNLVTGEPIVSPGQSFIDPNMRYQQMSQMGTMMQTPASTTTIPGRVSTFGATGYTGGMFGQVGAPYQIPGMIQMPVYTPQYTDKIQHVPGYNPRGSSMIFPENIEEICDQLQLEMEMENEKAIARRNARYQGMFNYSGSNYYGWYNNYPDQDVIAKYREKAMEIRREAERRTIDLNKKLSRLAHGYLEEEIDEDRIDMVYEGYDIEVKASQQQYEAKQTFLNNLVPVSNQKMYENHFNEIRAFYQKVFGENPDMQKFLADQGVLKIVENIEEELHVRRDATQYYNNDAYRRILRKNILEREGIKEDTSTTVAGGLQLPQFASLSQSARLLDDGSISLSAPSWVGAAGGKSIQLNNEMEKHFEENRNKFLESIYRQNAQSDLPFK